MSKILLIDVIEEMKKVGDYLVPYNWPQNNPELEADLHSLKSRVIDVDGYSIMIHFNRADYTTHYVETLQIMAERYPFLPFSLVSYIGKKFLGEHQLYLVELVKDNRKIYCWTITLDKNGKPIEPQSKLRSETCDYEGFEYEYMQPSQVNFY